MAGTRGNREERILHDERKGQLPAARRGFSAKSRGIWLNLPDTAAQPLNELLVRIDEQFVSDVECEKGRKVDEGKPRGLWSLAAKEFSDCSSMAQTTECIPQTPFLGLKQHSDRPPHSFRPLRSFSFFFSALACVPSSALAHKNEQKKERTLDGLGLSNFNCDGSFFLTDGCV